jgi:transcription elongation factor Elf1
MDLLQESAINCPYCGETISIVVDGSVEEQHYIEDCEVCCRPMEIRVNAPADGSIRVDVRGEND